MINLDLKDKRIIYELEKNARASVSDISRKVRLSKQLVSYKLKKLEEKKVILGYHAFIDTSKLGYTTYRVYLKLQNLNIENKNKFIKYLASLNEITILLTINGRWDLGCAIMVQDVYKFYEVWEKIVKFRENIDNYQICIYSPIYHFTRTFLSPEKADLPKMHILGGNEKIEFDEWDLKILKALAPNIRTPLIEIAEYLNRSLPFVINRLKELEKKEIIMGYEPILNWKDLGFEYYKVDITLISRKSDKEIFDFCRNNEFIFQKNYNYKVL